jgi:tetraacyldisaccharide 4'-kinase
MTSSAEQKRSPPLPGPLGRLAARVYGAEIARRNRRFDAGVGVMRFPLPVVSVGNLSVGGTGKTPLVCRILAACEDSLSLKPCVAMRGYGAESGESDEAREYAGRFPGVPVVAQPDRAAGLRALLASDRGRDVRLIVLDDGFQHRQIARNLDIVLLDATRSPFGDRLLPAGWLREPVESLARAHLAVITHAEAAPPGRPADVLRQALAVNPGLTTAVTSHRWGAIRASHPDPAGGPPAERDEVPARLFQGRILIACAIGNPGPFVAEAQRHIGGPAAGVFVRPDHDPYGPSTVRSLIRAARSARADAILTTEKDWSKLRRVPHDRWPCPVLRPRLVMTFDAGEAEFLGALARAAAGGAPARAPRCD